MTQTLRNVFVIDDDKANNFLCKVILEEAGVQSPIQSFYMVEDALRVLSSMSEHVSDEFPDLILLDVNLPGADGWDFLDNFRKLSGQKVKLPIVYMLTSSIYQEDIDKAASYPEVKEFLPKPLTIELVDKIRRQYFRA
jgi:CheY-like chemotaxis protein